MVAAWAATLAAIGSRLRRCATLLLPRGRRLERQEHPEGAALVQGAFDLDASSVPIHELAHQRQPQTQALYLDTPRLGRTVKLLEDPRLHFVRHADSRVRDLHPGPALVVPLPQRHPTA